MIIWMLLLVPIIDIVILFFAYRKKIAWWECLLQFGVAILLIVIAKYTIETSLTSDTEYWGDLVVQTEYYEEYTLWDNETCYRTETYPCGTDSKGNTKYCTRSVPYDCSHVDYYPRRWIAITASGWRLSISQDMYTRLVKKFKQTPAFQMVDHKRECGFGDYIIKDGGMYYAKWPGTSETSHMVAETHQYENKVQCTNSLYNYPEVTPTEKSQYGLYDYPKVSDDYDLPTVLGTVIPDQAKAEQKLKFINGDLGPKKQVHVWVVLFRNKPIEAGEMQESYWKGSNKNEFVITIGLNNLNEVQWCHVFSFTEVQEIKITARNFIATQKKLNLVTFADFLYPELSQKWIRKQFVDFNYLTVEPPLWALIMVFIIQIVFNVLYSIWAARNSFTLKDPTGSEERNDYY